MPDGNTADLLARLRQCASGLSCSDVVIRARLACALAEVSLTRLHRSRRGRRVHAADATGRSWPVSASRWVCLCPCSARLRDARRNDEPIDLWRQAILLSSKSRLYGDVAECRRALNAAIFEQPVLAFAELAPPGPLPNDERLLAVPQSAELNALHAAHADKLPDAFSVTRRHLWETRLSGHLTDEREALELFGDVLLAARRPAVAVTAWVMAGAANKAAVRCAAQ